MKIAIVGTGISGLTCAHLLSRRHEITVFEAADYVGGHTATVDVDVPSGRYAIDTGFIVYNDWTYPNFIKLMSSLDVASQATSMSFSVKAEASGLEYNGTDLNGLFAQRRNLLSPSFLRMIRDLLRFNRDAPSILAEDPSNQETLGQYLARHRYSAGFKQNYIVPMGAAIWSASVRQMEDFPIRYFVEFFKNHGMLSVNDRPTWRVIRGGSRSYIAPLIAPFRDRIRLRSPVLAARRSSAGVRLSIGSGDEAQFDQVIFASHSDQTLKILSDANPAEQKILGAFAYQENDTVLHTDIRVLPKRKRAWAAWNYFVPTRAKDRVAVTYDMNILQGLSAPETFCVSLNMDQVIDPARVLRRFIYHHPVYTADAIAAQKSWAEVSGKNGTHFCGAYWGFGFHEDGVKSALRVCEQLGETL